MAQITTWQTWVALLKLLHCFDIIWEQDPDKDGRHLSCYVYQEPVYKRLDSGYNIVIPD